MKRGKDIFKMANVMYGGVILGKVKACFFGPDVVSDAKSLFLRKIFSIFLTYLLSPNLLNFVKGLEVSFNEFVYIC